MRLEAALRNGLAARGVPDSIYLDNGSAMIDKQLLRACACWGSGWSTPGPGSPRAGGRSNGSSGPSVSSSSSRSAPAANWTT